MKFSQTDAPPVAAAKAALSGVMAYRCEWDPGNPSQNHKTRHRRRPDPLADVFESEIVPMPEA